MYRFNQHSFVGGQLDRGLMGRQDLERYFQGASKLENFIVRKQGNITKRRGTEMMADLGNLFGTGDSIAYSRILPFSYEITVGYYLLLAESAGSEPKRGAFIISDDGMKHKQTITKTKLDSNGAETGEIELSEGYDYYHTIVRREDKSEETKDGARWKVATVTEPDIINVPYRGIEFSSLGYNQSGDTLFIVHKNYPPAKVVNNGLNFKYEVLDFNKQFSGRPSITSIQGTGFTGTGNKRSVLYVCTAVTDGIESIPSPPVEFEYHLPWDQNASVIIKCNKGSLSNEPDYYNVYKSIGGEYGFVLSTSSASEKTYEKTQVSIGATSFTTAGRALKSTDAYPSLNPVKSSGGLVFEFKDQKAIVGVQVIPDFRGSNATAGNGTRAERSYAASGDTLICEATIVTSSGGEQTFTDMVYKPSEIVPGGGKKHITTTFNGMMEIPVRVVNFDFSGYTRELERGWYLKRLTLSSKTGDTPKTTYISDAKDIGLAFSPYSISIAQSLTDDYITPNLAFTPPSAERRFEGDGNYPSCISMYTQRLALAATEKQPFTWWMSTVGDLYNFNTHKAIRQDDALEASVPATEFPNINHMVLSRDLILFCDNGEWVVRPLSGNTLAYDTVECKRQSAIGCAKSVQPLQVGDEIIFADNSKRVVRSIKYQFSSDGYESNDLSILSQSIFFTNPVISMCYKQHPESLILCELSDGTIAALVYMREHNVVAWTHHSLGGGWKCRGIASNKAHADETTHVAMLVERDDGGIEIWRIRDDDESTDLYAQLCLDGLRYALGDELGEAAFEGGQIVVDLATGESLKSFNEVVAEKEYAVGYPFTSTLISVRPEPQGAETFQWELKNAKKVHIRTLNGSSFQVKEAGMSDDYASHVEIKRTVSDGKITGPGLVDATDILLNGENSRDGRIEIKHDGILPLTIESFSVDYETQPLYGSDG